MYDAHSRIPKLKYFGECLEMDACEDYWLGIEFGSNMAFLRSF